MQAIVSVMLREGGLTWIAAGAAGGSELPAHAEPYRMQVALPVALAKELGLGPAGAAEMGASASCAEESFGPLRWTRARLDLPAGSFAKLGLSTQEGQARAARAMEAVVGVPMFARFEVDGLEAGRGDWVSPGRDPESLLGLFCALEAKALSRAAGGPSSAGRGPSRI